jgi:hypothetical protein
MSRLDRMEQILRGLRAIHEVIASVDSGEPVR